MAPSDRHRLVKEYVRLEVISVVKKLEINYKNLGLRKGVELSDTNLVVAFDCSCALLRTSGGLSNTRLTICSKCWPT